MYHGLAQDKSPWRALLSAKVGLVFVVIFCCVFLSHSFAQIQDITPPTLTAFAFTPATIDTSAGPAVVTANFSVTDDLSGVAIVEVSFVSPSGTYNSTRLSGFSPPVTSGNGIVTLPFPQFSEVGTWTVNYVVVIDAVSNRRTYSATDLSPLGFPTELEVVGQAEDITPPVITIAATPKTLWPPNGKMVTVTISGTITDTESGVNASTAVYAVTDEYGLIQPNGKVILGSNGSYLSTIQLEASRRGNDQDGRHYIITISAQDNAGNKGSKSAIVTVPHDRR